LEEAYETGLLKGHSLAEARRIIEKRRTLGPGIAHSVSRQRSNVTTSSLVRAYQREVARQRLMIKKAELTQQRLLIIASALRQLVADDHFLTLLRAEGLDTMPEYLAQRVWPSKGCR
jgi:ParB family chromosome partitioning protein